MKRIGFIFSFLLLYIFVNAQEQLTYNFCGEDFSPLSMRTGLPENAIYPDTGKSASDRAKDVISRLTFDEKLTLTGGWNRFYFPPVPRLGLRPIFFADASQGIRINQFCWEADKTTSFPSELALMATWNPHLAYRYAYEIGEECQALGVSVLLGPGSNMYRNPAGGRNFEYLGEDPFLGSVMSVEYVKGLQNTGTMATLKTFIGTEQEFARHIVNVKVDERAFREIYLPAFIDPIEQAGVLAIMTGNNAVNGHPGAANKPLSNDVLRKEFGYKGIIMSDWANSTYWPDKQNLILGSGHSLLMENNDVFKKYIYSEIKKNPNRKKDIEKELDTMVFYNLYSFFKMGFYDQPYRDISLIKEIPAHVSTALKTAEEAITLLKNEDGILPIDAEKVKKIAVVGKEEALNAATGKGSGDVLGYNRVNYLEGLQKIYGDKVFYSVDMNEEAIRSADIVLFFIDKLATEGSDIPYDLPQEINNRILACSHINKNIVVIYSGGNGFSMPWLSHVKGVIMAYLLGQESGNALANIISGKVSPSGKLPFTIEKSIEDNPSNNYNLMVDGKLYWEGHKPSSLKYREMFGDNLKIIYKEGIFMGYRGYEKDKVAVQFPFGFGLSYTTFEISDLEISSDFVSHDKTLIVSFDVKNTGKVRAAEVTQLYIQDLNPDVPKPLKELKGFKKVFLEPGESKTIYLPLTLDSFTFWDIEKHQWKASPGDYSIIIGTSSQDIKGRLNVKVL